MSRAAAVAPPSAKTDTSRSPAPPLRARPPTVHAPPVATLHGGSPLPPTLRQRMEASFGEPFHNVRVHTDAPAERFARGQRAEAVTVGHRIAFGAGRYRPGTPSGDHLVAHELAHVAQQRHGGGGAVQARTLSSRPSEPAETAAESAADMAVRGGRVTSLGPSYSARNRLMRRALNRLAPPPNPAPLRSLGGPTPEPKPTGPKPRPPASTAEQPAVRPEVRAAVERDAESPARRLPAESAQASQEQTEDVREQAQEALAEQVEAEQPAGGAVEVLAGEDAGAAVETAVEEPPSEAAADMKEEAEAGKESEAAGEEAKADGETEAATEAQAPRRPQDDPGFRAVVNRTRRVGAQQAHNNAAQRKAAEAQAAAPAPANEVEAAAAGNQVGKMAEQEPAPFDKAAFKAALTAKINQIAPNTLEQADEFKSSGRAADLKGAVVGEVEAGKEGAAGPIKETSEEAPDPSSVTPKAVEPLPPTEPGPPPPSVGAAAAAPKPKGDSEVSLEAGVDDINARMESAEVTEETLLNSNEPDMIGAVEAKHEHEQHAREAPEAYRQDEQSLLSGAQGQAESESAAGSDSMYSTRGQQFAGVLDEQVSTQGEETSKETALADRLQSIFETAQTDVRTRLETLDTEVNTIFDSGAETARINFDNYVEREKEAYKDRRYSGLRGKARWLRDIFLPLPDEVNRIYQQGRDLYIQEMDGVIDQVASAVETGLNDAASTIAKGRADVETEIESARQNGVTLGEQAMADIQAQFDTLENEVKSFEQRTVDSLAQRYVENLQAVDARIEEMKQADRGLLGRAFDAIEGAIRTILELKELLLGVLAKAASVIKTIIADPIGFLGNLIAGIKAGLSAFVGNIAEHLKQGLMGWLFGAVAAAGITIPETFDLQGILSLAAQVLGLTYANIRSRAVRIVGEPVVQALETAAEIFKILMTEGIAGVWSWIKDMLGNLAETVLGSIRDWVIQKVVVAGIAWIVSLLSPASALVRAVKAIIDIVLFFINRGSQILALVNAVLDSIAAIASGSIGAMASAIEGALARALPVAISFLASLLGLGGVSSVIREAIEKIQAPINRAIDWLINKAVKLVKAVGGLFGGGKKEEDSPDTDDPEHDVKVTAGLAAIDEEEQKHLEGGKIERAEAADVAATVKRNHPIFRSLTVVDGGSRWNYRYEASEGQKEGEEKEVEVAGMKFVIVSVPGGASVTITLEDTGDEAVIKARASTAKKIEALVNGLDIDESEAVALVGHLPGTDLDGLLATFARVHNPSVSGSEPPEEFLVKQLREQRITSAAVATLPARETRSKLVNLGEGREPLSNVALVFRPGAVGQFQSRTNPEAQMTEFIFHGRGRPEVFSLGVVKINDSGVVVEIVAVSDRLAGGKDRLAELMRAAGWRVAV